MFLSKNNQYTSHSVVSRREVLGIVVVLTTAIHILIWLHYVPRVGASPGSADSLMSPAVSMSSPSPTASHAPPMFPFVDKSEKGLSDSSKPDDSVVPGHLGDFPALIWQTSGPQPLGNDRRDDVGSWRNKNPFFTFMLKTDEQADSFVREHFSHRQDIVDLFLTLPIAILKADLFRYLVLIAKGGVYADLDVACEKPVGEWLPIGYSQSVKTANLVVGLEFDYPWEEGRTNVASQMTNWAIMAKPGSKHLERVVDMAVDQIHAIAKENKVGIDGLKLIMMGDVVDLTGPKRMTLSILESLSEDLGVRVDDRDIAGIKEPKLVGDVLVMPGNSFAGLQNGFPEDQTPALVAHHYAGSWKTAANGDRMNEHEEDEKARKEEEDRKKQAADEEQQKKEGEERRKKVEQEKVEKGKDAEKEGQKDS